MSETIRWFGPEWANAPIAKYTPEMETPIGSVCIHCEKPIEAGESGLEYAGGTGIGHRACFLENVGLLPASWSPR